MGIHDQENDVDRLLRRTPRDVDMHVILEEQNIRVNRLKKTSTGRNPDPVAVPVPDPDQGQDYGHGSQFSVPDADAGICSNEPVASTARDEHKASPGHRKRMKLVKSTNRFLDTQAKVDDDDDDDDYDYDQPHTSDDGFVVPDENPLIYDSNDDELMKFDDTDGSESSGGLLSSEETGHQPRKGHKRNPEKVLRRKRKRKGKKTSGATQISRAVLVPRKWPQYANALEQFQEYARDVFGNSVPPTSEEMLSLLRDFTKTLPFFFMLAHETTRSDVLDLDGEEMIGARAVRKNWNNALTTFIGDLLQVAVDGNSAPKRDYACANIIEVLEHCHRLDWFPCRINAQGYLCSFTGEALELGEDVYAVRATGKDHANDFYVRSCPGIPALYMHQLLAYYHFRWARSVFVCDIRRWQAERARGDMTAFLSAENTSFIVTTIAKYVINKFTVKTMMRPVNLI